jgi:16S rRNA (guanine(966)-N(2))-methyltransferase RsmD
VPPIAKRSPRPRAAPPNRIRIIGGTWRSRVLRIPDLPGLRPTPARVRETLFNWLGQDLAGRRCLDLFAGSGALGFEALSRGAREVVWVEHSRAAAAQLQENASALRAAGGRIAAVDALHFLADPGSGRFDVVFVDPPYGSGLAERALAQLGERLAAGGCVYVETDAPLEHAPGWRVVRQGRAGAVHYHLVRRVDDDHQGGVPGNV